MAELGLSNMQMGYVFGVFSISYGICEIPMGYLVDRVGQRQILTRIVACWSFFTALTGTLWGYGWLLGVRLAFGAAEAGAFPAFARAIGKWFRLSDRGKAIGVMWMSARIGGSLAPPFAMLLIGWVGWRTSFVVFGVFGAIWCAIFWRSYRDDPAQHPAATAADLAYARGNCPPTKMSESIPWRRILFSSNLLALFWMYFATSYGFWFLLTWLPTYLIRQYHMSPQRANLYAALPLAVGSISCLAGGSLSDFLVDRLRSLRWGRRLVGLGGYLLSGLGFAAAGFMREPSAAIVSLIVAEVGIDLATPVAWTASIEIGGSFGGTVAAFMNSSSSISAFISPIAAAWIFTKFRSFDAMLVSAGLVYLTAAFLWLKIDAGRPLDPRGRVRLIESCGV
jgi:sugar phosphate permease